MPADLKITIDGKNLVFESKGKAILRTTPEDFFSNSGRVLKEFSLRTDKHVFFRQLTFVCLLIGFPLTLYVIVYALFRFVLCFFLQVRTASAIASILCFLIGITLLAIFYHSRGEKIELRDLAEALKSKHWQERVAALKTIEQKGTEVSNFEPYRSMLTSRHIPERYWLVRALGVSRQPKTYQDLLAFLNDPHPNVVSMAFFALGRRGDRSAVEEILERVETSDNWYNQRYAYKALRSLGWKQTKSN